MEEQISRIAAQVASRLFVEVEASGRHVHLTKDQAMTLFGHGLTPKRAPVPAWAVRLPGAGGGVGTQGKLPQGGGPGAGAEGGAGWKSPSRTL